ncbi:methyltransferase [Candidatus Micrarchaeota archaeon]|nr:methyltransferase [Candidatus Micrarchaeota archaeon]
MVVTGTGCRWAFFLNRKSRTSSIFSGFNKHANNIKYMEFIFDSLSLQVPGQVYQPAEDSFLLAEAAKDCRGRVLEMGCGCGLASLVAAKNAEHATGADINPLAVRCAGKNAELNNITNADFVESDLFSAVNGSFDTILFNPPYLPTRKGEKLPGRLNRAFDGGSDGRSIIDRFLQDFDSRLAPPGRLYLVQSSANNPEKTFSLLREKGFSAEAAKRQDFFFEHLLLLRAKR